MRVLWFRLLTVVCISFLSMPAKADFNSYVDFVKKDINDIYLSKNWDLYVPAWTWHNRSMYDKDKTDSYNEFPVGLGFGKHIYDGNQIRGLYFMMFSDSHSKAEPIFGYLQQWNHYIDENKNFSVGAGYTFGLTFRDDYSYLPFPFILPVFSMQYRKVALQATYIPGPYNMFNVFFAWLRVEL